MFNKKGIAIKRMLLMLYRFVYAIFCIGMVILAIKLVVFTSLDTEILEVEVFTNRIYNSGAIMYVDADTGRVFPGIIDFEKFTSENLERDINYSNKYRITAKLTLKNNTDKVVSEITVNKKLWKILYERVSFRGAEGGVLEEIQYPITYIKDSEYHNGFLEIIILRQND